MSRVVARLGDRSRFFFHALPHSGRMTFLPRGLDQESHRSSQNLQCLPKTNAFGRTPAPNLIFSGLIFSRYISCGSTLPLRISPSLWNLMESPIRDAGKNFQEPPLLRTVHLHFGGHFRGVAQQSSFHPSRTLISCGISSSFVSSKKRVRLWLPSDRHPPWRGPPILSAFTTIVRKL